MGAPKEGPFTKTDFGGRERSSLKRYHDTSIVYNACLDELHPALECGQLFCKTSIESMTGKADNMGLFRSADIHRYAGKYIDTRRRLMNNTYFEAMCPFRCS